MKAGTPERSRLRLRLVPTKGVCAIASHVSKEEIRDMGGIGIGSHYQYRKAGMTIGSGAIESVHKWVIQARCKQAGMASSEQGINAMLRLRCVWASGRWDEIFALPKGADGKLF